MEEHVISKQSWRVDFMEVKLAERRFRVGDFV